MAWRACIWVATRMSLLPILTWKNFHGSYKEVADQHDPKFYPKYSFLPTNTLRIATPPRVLCMRVNATCILGAPKLPRAIKTAANHPVRSALWNTKFTNLLYWVQASAACLAPWMCVRSCAYIHTWTSHSFKQRLRFLPTQMRTALFANGIPSGVEPDVAFNLPVQRGCSWIPCIRPRKSSSWENHINWTYWIRTWMMLKNLMGLLNRHWFDSPQTWTELYRTKNNVILRTRWSWKYGRISNPTLVVPQWIEPGKSTDLLAPH